MNNRYSLALLTLAAVVLGYLASNTAVKAQDTAVPFVTGDTVTLRFGGGSLVSNVREVVVCSIADIRGTYVRCATPPRRSNVAPMPPEMWFNMQSVTSVVIER